MSYINDTAYSTVRSFHFVLFVIKMHDGVVEVYDSLKKDPNEYRTAYLMLAR
jgi:hypothetical protein